MKLNFTRSLPRLAPVLLTILALSSMTGCLTSQFAGNPLETVAELDVERYLGRWYEIARFQRGFERDIFAATAEYSLRPDGRIRVVNSGFRRSVDGPYTSVEAVAWRPDDQVPGALKVRFFNLFTSDYLVFGLDSEDYQWALVGSNNRNFIWFLSRTPELPEETLAEMRAIAVAQGYDLTELFFVPQKPRD